MNMAEHGKNMQHIAEAHKGLFEEPLEDYLASPAAEIEFGYYAELSASKDERDFTRRIDTLISRLGFSHYALVWLESSDDIDSPLLVTIPRDLRESYYSGGLYEHDLIISYGKSAECSIYHSKVHDYIARSPVEIDMTLTMKDISQLNKHHGFYDYYNVTAKSNKNDGNVMLSVAIKGKSPFEFKAITHELDSTLRLLCEAIDYVAVNKFPNTFLGKRPIGKRAISINPKPLRVLDTLANNDLNVSQVADKLCISVVTANKHLETARKAFGARTTHAAIRRAVMNGLIDYQLD